MHSATQRASEGSWEFFPHDADVGLRGFGPDEATAFEQAAIALTAIVTDPQTVEAHTGVQIVCEAPDHDLLLADWLNAVIYEMAVRKMLFRRFAVEITGRRLTAQAWGEVVEPRRHQPAAEPKGATYTELLVRPDPTKGWVAQCVIDV